MQFIRSIARTLRRLAPRIGARAKRREFEGSAAYWAQRYAAGGTSGAGSYGRLADFKAEILNEFVHEHAVESVIEFGCGDGNQLSLMRYPRYLGIDVSPTAIAMCNERFAGDSSRAFALASNAPGGKADLALSLDVIYHLVEDSAFESYMATLFGSAERYVIIYSSNHEGAAGETPAHVRHRRFSTWIDDHAPAWRLMCHVPNRYPGPGDRETSFADFHVYERVKRGSS